MTFAKPRRNPAGDSRYAFTALARGAWDGRWEQRPGQSHPQNSAAFGGGRRTGRGRRGAQQGDSHHDPRNKYDAEELNEKGLPIPNFAPLPSYSGGFRCRFLAITRLVGTHNHSKISLFTFLHAFQSKGWTE